MPFAFTSTVAMRLWRSLSTIGILVGLLFFAGSLTPSLMPRSYVVQGTLSGVCASIGYMLGVFLAWLWRYLELPVRRRSTRPVHTAALTLALLFSTGYLWRAAEWQNSIRVLWEMEPLDSADPIWLGAIAFAIFLVLLMLGRLFSLAAERIARRLRSVATRRISAFLGVAVAAALFWLVGQGFLLQWALGAADASFRQADSLIDADTPAPQDPTMTGSAQSRVSWEGMGSQGRYFIDSGPRADAIGSFWRTDAVDPIRVYVGLNNAESASERAALALQEMQRQGAFERSVLVVIAPTGTGWVDPAAMDTLEYLHRGDVASVAVQYSYLTSWLSLLVEPEQGREAAAALFRAVYDHWKTLPRDTRPRLYLHGLSLGALNSQDATDIYDVVADPFHGALWSGPPFRSTMWRSFTARRDAGSPAWLPRYRDGSLVRFANQRQGARQAVAQWGAIRFVYLQYASDPVVFFEPSAFWTEPQWLRDARGPDVSPAFTWLPLVTGLQLTFDMAIATTSPIGYGHVYAPQHYIDAWIALTDPQDITPEDAVRLATEVGKNL